MHQTVNLDKAYQKKGSAGSMKDCISSMTIKITKTFRHGDPHSNLENIFYPTNTIKTDRY